MGTIRVACFNLSFNLCSKDRAKMPPNDLNDFLFNVCSTYILIE